MSKQVLEQALYTIYHMRKTMDAGPEYDPQSVDATIEAIHEALVDPVEKQLNESVEERLQRVEKGLRWLGWLRDQQATTFGGCPQRGTKDPDDICAVCDCWKGSRAYCS